MGLYEAVSAAVDRCIAEGVLADYLGDHRAEARDMLFTIEDEERAMRVHWEWVEREARAKGLAEGRAEGLEQGLEQATLASLRNLMETTGCDVSTAMDMLQVAAADRERLAAQL